MNNELFIVQRDKPHVYVYNADNYTYTRSITITGSLQLWAIAASPRHNSLYISDTTLHTIHLYNLSNNNITSWKVGDEC